IWGYVADAITVFMLAVSVAHVAQGYIPYGVSVAETSLESFFMRPEAADTYADPATVNRIWDNIYARLFAPITLLWIFALSTGQGLTARVLRFNTISQTLAPTAYACFLFHQMVGQWYFAATRNGEWWNWWSDQKSFYWFSPQPVPVEWYEYFYVVGLVVLFAKIIQPIDPILRRGFTFSVSLMKTKSDTRSLAKDTTTEVLLIVERMTGIEVKPEWNLAECGLASLGIVQLTNTLETKFSTTAHKIRLPVSAIIAADNIREIASIVDAAVSEEELQPSTSAEVLQTS
ncbi:acyl carrier protein, partial [uncultured Paraglaciecola sp.]|uniref:acyl carrier protein n=1 Tax=uncultured Paraglaciecola sp. TaxID=1765024 RepID=UPI0025F21D9D